MMKKVSVDLEEVTLCVVQDAIENLKDQSAILDKILNQMTDFTDLSAEDITELSEWPATLMSMAETLQTKCRNHMENHGSSAN
jgi:hypothetical protein